MTSLEKVMVIGASLGLSEQIAKLFPAPLEPKVQTQVDQDALSAAEQKRLRRAERNRTLERKVMA